MVKAPRFLLIAALVAGTACRRQSPAPAAAPAAAEKADTSTLPAEYDPTVLVEKGMDALQVYLKEPRNPTWATVVEEAIGGQMRRDLKQMIPEARNLSMGCRTLSCLILIDVPKDKLEAAGAVVGLVTLGPITVDLGLSPEGRGQVLVLTERRMADPAEFTAWYRKTRQRTLAEIRSGDRPNSLPVPVNQLPTE
jgi:hypothetical protein